MAAFKLDKVDLKILELLQEEGRTKRNELAEAVRLSLPSISERLKKLENAGIIKNYRAVLDSRQLALGITAFIFITSDSSKAYPQVIKNASTHPEILECHAITGVGSHILKVRTHNTETLEKLLSEIQTWPGVQSTSTDVVLSSAKETSVLPLKYVSEVIEQ